MCKMYTILIDKDFDPHMSRPTVFLLMYSVNVWLKVTYVFAFILKYLWRHRDKVRVSNHVEIQSLQKIRN